MVSSLQEVAFPDAKVRSAMNSTSVRAPTAGERPRTNWWRRLALLSGVAGHFAPTRNRESMAPATPARGSLGPLSLCRKPFVVDLAIYTRVSTDGQSLENQRRELLASEGAIIVPRIATAFWPTNHSAGRLPQAG